MKLPRRRELRLLWMALAVLLPGAASAAKLDVKGLTEWVAPSMTIYGHDETKASVVLRNATHCEQILTALLKREPRANGIPTLVVIPHTSVYRQYLLPGDSIRAEFVPTRFLNYVLIDSRIRDADLRLSAYHEFTHVFLRNQFAGFIPLWFDDGLAGVIRRAWVRGNDVRLGTKNWYASSLQMPTSRLLRIERHSPEYRDRRTITFHWESMLFVHKVLFGDAEFRRKTFDYIAALSEGLEIDDAVQRAYGHGVDELHETLNAYANQFYVNVADLRIEWAERPPLGKGRTLEEFEGLELVARVMLDTGFNPLRLEEVVQAAVKLQPDSPRANLLLLRLAVRDHDDVSLRNGLKRMEPQLKEPSIARAVGIALFERVHDTLPTDELSAEGRETFMKQGLDLLLASERVLPVDPEAAWALGQLAARLGRDLDFSLDRVEQAMQVMPRSADLSEVSARLLQRLDEREAMVAQLRHTLRNARTVAQIGWARDRLIAAGETVGVKQ